MWRSGSRSRRSAAALFALALFAAGARADEWHPVFTDDGVAVREREVPGRALPDFEGEVEIAADAYRIFAVLLDVPAQTAWMWQCEESRVLARDGDDPIVYHRLKARWPATDRNVVFRLVPRVVEPDRRLSVRLLSEANATAPPSPDLMRMPSLAAEFDLVSLSPTRTRVRYTVAADPGGFLPASYDDVAARWRARR